MKRRIVCAAPDADAADGRRVRIRVRVRVRADDDADVDGMDVFDMFSYYISFGTG